MFSSGLSGGKQNKTGYLKESGAIRTLTQLRICGTVLQTVAVKFLNRFTVPDPLTGSDMELERLGRSLYMAAPYSLLL